MTVNSLETLLKDPHLEATGFWQVMEHASEARCGCHGIRPSYAKTPGSIRRLPPRRRAQPGSAARGRVRCRRDRRLAGHRSHTLRVLEEVTQ